MAARRPLVAGNWKMYGTASEAAALARALKDRLAGVESVDVVVAPPYTALHAVRPVLQHTGIVLAAQNVHWAARGAFTGEIAAAMLHEAGCGAAIVGHSERRQLFGETDDAVRGRVRACLDHGLMPILCVGETLAERDASRTLDVVRGQLDAALDGLTPDQVLRVVLAYEPVWAIGTGRTATPAQAEEIHAFLRARVGTSFGAPVSHHFRILYGGSVKPDNIDDLMAQPDIDGALVGGASLKAEEFDRIVRFRGVTPRP